MVYTLGNVNSIRMKSVWQVIGPCEGIEESMREFLIGYVNTLAAPPSIRTTTNFGGYLRETALLSALATQSAGGAASGTMRSSSAR